MDRYSLTDTQWVRIQPLCLGKKSDPGRTGGDTRLFLEAILWIARTGSPWRDLPKHFGHWNTVFKRFRHWVKADVFKGIFDALSDDPDMGVEPLIEGVQFGGLIADKAFDSDWIIETLNERGAKIVISQHPRRSKPLDIDAEIYKWRHLIENFFCKLKEFKRIAMRSDKTDQSFAAMIYAGAAIINSR